MTKEIKATATTPQDWIELVRENERLKALQSEILKVEHERGGSLGVDGQFYYKVPESVFKMAKKLENKTND